MNLPRPSRVAGIWAGGWAIAALGPLRLSAAGDRSSVAVVALGALIVAIGSALLCAGSARRRSRIAGALLYAALWLAAVGLVLLLRPVLLEVHEVFGLHLGAAVGGALVGVVTAAVLGSRRSGSVAGRWVLLPLLVGLLWSIIMALGLQIALLGWYALGQLLFKPILGAEIGFLLSALAGGALGGAFAGYFCTIVLGFTREPS